MLDPFHLLRANRKVLKSDKPSKIKITQDTVKRFIC